MSNPINDLLRARQVLVAEISNENKSLAEKNKKLSKIDAELASRLGQLAKAFGGAISRAKNDSAQTQTNIWPPSVESATDTKKGKGSYLSEPIRNILRASGRPLTTNELFAELEKQQIKVGGKRPLGNLSAHLTNVEGIIKEGRAWALKANAHVSH